MDKDNKLAPELRFEGFKNDWVIHRISEIYKAYSGLRNKNKDHFKKDGLPFITYKQVFDSSKISGEYGRVLISDDENQNVANFGDVFFTISSETPNEVGMSSVLLERKSLYLNSFCFGIKPDLTKIDPYFSRFVFRSEKFRSEVIKLAQGSTRYNVSKLKLMELPFYIPSKREQKRIGNFLSKVDKRIKLLEEIKDLKKQYKKGLLQQMFLSNSAGGGALNVPSLRFKEFTEDWVMVKVKDIFKVTRGNVLSKRLVKKEKDKENKYPVFSSQTVNGGLMGYYKDFLFENCLTWTTDGYAGNVNFRKGKFYCTNVCGVLKSEKYNNKCIAEILNREAWKHVIHVGNPKLMNNVMSEIEIMIPPTIKEQERISSLFESIDFENKENEKEIKDLKIWKKGLLQRMFV